MENRDNNRSELLGSAPITSLMIKFAVPSIIAMLVGALYNIVDQLFIGHAVGQLGNAAEKSAYLIPKPRARVRNALPQTSPRTE